MRNTLRSFLPFLTVPASWLANHFFQNLHTIATAGKDLADLLTLFIVIVGAAKALQQIYAFIKVKAVRPGAPTDQQPPQPPATPQ